MKQTNKGLNMHLQLSIRIRLSQFLFVSVGALLPSQQFFSHTKTISCLYWLSQHYAEDKFKCRRGGIILTLLYPRKLCLWWGILFSRCPSVCACVCPCVRPSVTFCFFNNLKSHCWIFIKPCKHVPNARQIL